MNSSTGQPASTHVVDTKIGNNTLTNREFEEFISSFIKINISREQRDQLISSNLDMLMANNDHQSVIINSILSNVSHINSNKAIIAGACPLGYFVSAVLHNGSLRCAKYTLPEALTPFINDSLISVYGDGLTHNETAKFNRIGIDFTRVQRRGHVSECPANLLMRGMYQNGSVICQPADQTSFSIFAGEGLISTNTFANYTIRLDYSKIQRPLSPVQCKTGAFFSGFNTNGTMQCSSITNSGGDITSISVGSGLTSINATRGDATINVNYNIVQARVDAACPAGSSIRAIHEDGSVSCELDNDSGGDLTSVSVSNGLIGGGQVGDLTISANTSYLQKRINQQCNTGEYMRAIHKDGSVVCEADNDSGGDITSINVENGIIGGASNGDVSLSINTSAIQVRVGGICDPGSSIREIKLNGQVVCEIDDDSVFPMDAVLAVDGGNGIYIDRVNMSKVVVFANTSYLQKRVQGHCQAGEAINQIFDDGSIQCESMPVYTLNTTDIRMQQTLQRSCPNGSSIRSISPSGIVTCHVDKDGGGDITSVTVGNGLIGGGISGDVSITIDYAVVQKRNPESSMCSDGSGVQGLHQNGTLLCTPLFTGDITSIMTGNGLTGGGTGGDVDIDIDFSRVQKRASMASMMCPEGQYVNSLLENGTVLCSIDQNDGGDITAVNLGNGLLGGGSYGDVLVGIDYNIVQYRVASECPAGSAIRTISANGTVECELDNDGGGDITSVTVASGLTGGGDSGDVFVSINTSYVQRRVQQECGLGKYIRRINQDGTVVCVEDNNSGGDIFSIGVAHGLLGGGTSGDILLAINFSMVQSRILGSCAQGSSIRAIDSNGSVICEMDDNTFPDGNIVTEVSTGKGLIESGHNASHVRLAVDTGYIQRRISGNCSEGEAIQSILSDGSVLCESMPIYTLNTTAIRMQQTLQSSCPSGSSIQSISASGIVTCHTDIDSGGYICSDGWKWDVWRRNAR